MTLISLSPGAGAVASMSSGAAHGWRRGIWTAVGQQLALLLFLLISAVGLASLLTSVPASIRVLTLLGSAYLAWVGLRLIIAAFQQHKEAHEPVARAPIRKTIPSYPGGMVLHGFFVNASNPKALLALFVITPRFIDPAHSLPFQYCIIAGSMVAIDLAVMSGYTAIGSRILRSLTNDLWRRRIDGFFGCLFLIASALVAKS
jgi:homoserine/homoserine lactone efflux protein